MLYLDDEIDVCCAVRPARCAACVALRAQTQGCVQ